MWLVGLCGHPQPQALQQPGTDLRPTRRPTLGPVGARQAVETHVRSGLEGKQGVTHAETSHFTAILDEFNAISLPE